MMKKVLKKMVPMILMFTFVMLNVVPQGSYAATEGVWEYSVTQVNGVNMATIIWCNSTDANLTVPYSVGGYPVAAIGPMAFGWNTTMQSIDMSAATQLTTIADSSFDSCVKLKTVKFPSNLKTIGTLAFYMTALTDVVLPDSVTTIGLKAFNQCYSLTSIKFSKNLESIPMYAFWGDPIVEVDLSQCSKLTKINLGAFSQCTKLTSVKLPSSLTELDDYAFAHTLSLTQIDLPAHLQSIGVCAFHGSSLISVAIPETVTQIGESAFGKCRVALCSYAACAANSHFQLKAVTLPNVASNLFGFMRTPLNAINGVDNASPFLGNPIKVAIKNDNQPVSGNAQAIEIVTVKSGTGNILGFAETTATGAYSVEIPPQAPETMITYISVAKGPFSISEANSATTELSGTTAPSTNVTLKNAAGTVLGTATADSTGKFTVNLPSQTAGTSLCAYATNSDNNVIGYKTLSVTAAPAPTPAPTPAPAPAPAPTPAPTPAATSSTSTSTPTATSTPTPVSVTPVVAPTSLPAVVTLNVEKPARSPFGVFNFNEAYVIGYPAKKFLPTKAVTRSELATMLVKVMKLDVENVGNSAYADVKHDNWCFKYVQASTKAGIFKGYSDGTFKPNLPITRAELAAVFSNIWSQKGIAVSTANTPFKDVAGTWALMHVNRVYNAGYMTGFDGNLFKPNEKAKREQVVVMINKLINRSAVESKDATFQDVSKDYWAYGAIEAASSKQLRALGQ